MKQLLTHWRIFVLIALSCFMIAGNAPSSQLSPQALSKTYYVRADGSSKCTGLVDAPYPGSGTNQPCAWDHPFRALPPGGTPRIAGGDTLIIRAGSYRMGYGAPGATKCDAGGAFDCLMPAIPSGPDATHPTRILGAGWNTGCANPPQLWGAERPWFIVNLSDSSNVELGCMEITDHSGCVESHSGGLACERDDPPYGDWASYGLYAEDSANIHLYDLNIHGLAAGGVHAGRLTNWTVERVRVIGNGSVGWDGDLWDANGDSNSGTLTFRHLTVEWNGFGETYPGKKPTGCWAQSAGGYGDGFATGTSGGHWIVEDSSIRHNTSDGLDFLYVSNPGSSIEIRRTIVEGNAGNQIKNYRGPFTLEDSIVVGNCGFFEGKSFTYNVDNCRALGTALVIGLTRGGQAAVINNTFTSEGDCLVTAECSNGSCDGTETAFLRNNIFQGQMDFLQPFEKTCLVYEETFPSDPFDVDYSLVNNVKDNMCPGAHDICRVSPGLANTGIDTFNASLLPGSPAIDAGNNAVCTTTDQRGVTRPQGTQCDIGSYERISPNFNSSFNGSLSGWSAVTGNWSLYNDIIYRSAGLANTSASARHTDTYDNLTYEVRMKRTGTCIACPNRIIIRGNPASLNSTNLWKPSYVFQYTNDGRFSVYEMTSAGSGALLKTWTNSTSIVKNGWNRMKVVAVGSSLKFYINDMLVWTGSDTSSLSGQVGFGFYRDAAAGTLFVDWAKLSNTTVDFNMDLNEVVAPGGEVPSGNENWAP